MTRGRGAALALFAAGLVLRLFFLTAWGTFDVEVQKAWAWRAATSGLADIYGPADRELVELARTRGEGDVLRGFRQAPLPRTWFEWGTGRYFVDYPPGGVLGLWAAGKLHGLLDAEMRNRAGFNAAVNLAPLLASLAIALVLLRSTGDPGTGRLRALAFWLNPAVILAVPVLGYQDTTFGLLALLAVLALGKHRYAWATALVVAAGLVKPQGALLLPTLLAVLLREASPRVGALALGAGLGSATAILSPWWSSGHLLSALDGCLRPLTQTTLAPLGLNVWWIAGWLMDQRRLGGLPPARIVSLQEFHDASGLDAAFVARLTLLLLAVAIGFWVYRQVEADRRVIPLSVVLMVHGYALLGTSVHENHTFLALVVLPVLIGEWRPALPALAGCSVFLAASLLCTAGFGRRVTKLHEVMAARMATGIDASLLVALFHVALFGALVVWTRCLVHPIRSGRPASAR